jgi:hypothetical protein
MRHGCLLPPLGAQIAACNTRSRVASSTGLSLMRRMDRVVERIEYRLSVSLMTAI